MSTQAERDRFAAVMAEAIRRRPVSGLLSDDARKAREQAGRWRFAFGFLLVVWFAQELLGVLP